MAGEKKVLLLCGDYAEDYEVMVPFQALLAYGLSVDAVCPGKKAGEICRTAIHDFLGHQTRFQCVGIPVRVRILLEGPCFRISPDQLQTVPIACETYSESRGHNFNLNATFDEIEPSTYDGLIIPGGRAPEYLAMNESVLNLVRTFERQQKPIGSICHGQLVLAAADLVRGKRCTAYPTVGPVLNAAGANWVEPENMAFCTNDGNVITAATYGGHPEFIRVFMNALGAKISGSGKRILFLCGSLFEIALPTPNPPDSL